MTITVAGKSATIPDFLPPRGWSIHTKGYVIFTSRSRKLKRGRSAHREAIAHLIGRELATDETVHHQDFNKLNNCPCNLILMPAALNVTNSRRDPYTGQFLSAQEWVRRYLPPPVTDLLT